MSALPSSATFDEHLNEQLINCLNVQTNVIRNLTQYSQHISLQLIEIKNNVNILTNRVMSLEQEQLQSYFLPPVPMHIPPPLFDPLFFLQPTFDIPSSLNKPFFPNISDFTAKPPPPPFLFATAAEEQLSRNVPLIFNPIHSTIFTHLNDGSGDVGNAEESILSFRTTNLPSVNIKTGEENETVLFCERAKLYRYDALTNHTKDREVGELKILQHKATHLCRIVMCHEQVSKVCANHQITSQMELRPYQEKENAFIWTAIDYANGMAKHEIFCVKFKTKDQAKIFGRIFNQAKEINRNQSDDLPSIGRISLADDDVIVIGEVKPTRKQIELAKRLQLPPTFYLYENKEPCKGCRGCEEDSSSNLSDEIQYGNQRNSNDAAAVTFENFPSGFFPNVSLPALMSMMPTWLTDGTDPASPQNMSSPQKDHRMIVKAKRSLPSNRAPPPPRLSPPPPSSYPDDEDIFARSDERSAVRTHQKKSRNLSDQVKQEFSEETQIVTTKEDKISTSHVDNNKPSTSTSSTNSIFGNLTPVTTSSFSFNTFDKTTSGTEFQFSTPNSSATTNTSSIFTFGHTPQLTFADLVKQTSDNKFPNNDMDKRVFSGQGALIFDTNTTTTNEDDDDDDDGDGDSFVPTGSFKIVDLLPVEVKTGEENEDILLCERAKLYRFDAPTNQMKERGIGEMKILQHKTTHLCRLVMRREKVLKVCANHQITSQMELTPHQEKENAYIWKAMDYADGIGKHETLCIKFKTKDQAKRFFQQFNDAKLTKS